MGEFIDSFIGFNQITTVLIGAFVICFVGYLIGKISIKGVQLGTAGVFLAALVFGYLYTLPVLEDLPFLWLTLRLLLLLRVTNSSRV